MRAHAWDPCREHCERARARKLRNYDGTNEILNGSANGALPQARYHAWFH